MNAIIARWGRLTRGGGVALAILSIISLATLAEPAGVRLDASGEGEGGTVLYFNGPLTTAVLTATLALEGRLGDVQSQSFQVLGKLDAVGEAELSTLKGNLWGTLSALGTTADGRALELRGGLFVGSEDAKIDLAGTNTFSGRFYLSIRLGDVPYEATGTFQGSAVGVYVVPDDPMTMQLDGTAELALSGEAVQVAVAADGVPSVGPLPWDLSTWPEEVAERLTALLSWRVQP
jgi:hypothetical protein